MQTVSTQYTPRCVEGGVKAVGERPVGRRSTSCASPVVRDQIVLSILAVSSL